MKMSEGGGGRPWRYGERAVNRTVRVPVSLLEAMKRRGGRSVSEQFVRAAAKELGVQLGTPGDPGQDEEKKHAG